MTKEQAKHPQQKQTIKETNDFDFDFDVTRFRSLQSQDHVQVLKTETDWPEWSEDGADQIVIVAI